uniref:C2H2-type domain-containing protein n=1 Tax=Strongyloides papillosus TaxID=174720 RepID=A0A0N5B6P8_STREA
MSKESILKELNDKHCLSILDNIDITIKSSTHRKCVSCGKEFLLGFSFNTIYKHCVIHQELRKIIKSNIPGSYYEKYIRLANVNVDDLGEKLNVTQRNDVSDRGDKITNEMEVSTMDTSQREIIKNNTVVSGFNTENNSRNENINKQMIEKKNFGNTLKENNFINLPSTPDTISNDLHGNGLSSIDRSLKFFKRTNILGITKPISDTKHKCVSCEYIYPSKMLLIEIYAHAAGHDELLLMLKNRLTPSFLKIVLRKKDQLLKLSSRRSSKAFKPRNDNQSNTRNVSLSHSFDNEKKQTTKQPCLEVIEKLRHKPFETDVIKLTHTENGYRICNECKEVFTLNDRPYDIYKHCFRHRNFHKILMDNLQHEVLLEMLKKAKREEKVQNNKKISCD